MEVRCRGLITQAHMYGSGTLRRRLTPAPARASLQGIVADVQLSNTNYLTHNRVYSKVGQTELLVADPAMVHFGGFQVGEVYKQTLRITNTFTAGTRVHIIPPTTPFFKASTQKQ